MASRANSWTHALCMLAFLSFHTLNMTLNSPIFRTFAVLCVWNTRLLSYHMTLFFFKFNSWLQFHLFKEMVPWKNIFSKVVLPRSLPLYRSLSSTFSIPFSVLKFIVHMPVCECLLPQTCKFPEARDLVCPSPLHLQPLDHCRHAVVGIWGTDDWGIDNLNHIKVRFIFYFV